MAHIRDEEATAISAIHIRVKMKGRSCIKFLFTIVRTTVVKKYDFLQNRVWLGLKHFYQVYTVYTMNYAPVLSGADV